MKLTMLMLAMGVSRALSVVHVCLAADGVAEPSAQAKSRLAEVAHDFVPPVLPPAGHPRLMVRPADLPDMKRRFGDPAFARFAARARALSESGWNGELPVPARFDTAPRNWMEWGRSSRGLAPSKSQNYDPRLHDLIECCALRYLLEQDEAMGKRAIQLLETILATVTFPSKKEAMDITRGKGATITTAAIVYDWCYPLLNASQKAAIIAHLRRIAALTEVGFPPVRSGAVVGHGGEANVFRDLTAAGIAVFDEDPEFYRVTARRLFQEHIPARNFFYPSHWHHQGSSYGHVRAKWELWCACIFQRMTGARVFAAGQEQLLYANYYALRPDHVQLADGDSSSISKRWNNHATADKNGELLTVFLSHDPVIAGMLQQHIGLHDDITDTLPYFLFAQPQLATQPLESLPLSRYFKDPAGVLLARTGWQEGKDAPTVVTMMKIAPWMFGNHQHLDAGHFQLWYKGMLAVDSGAYAGGYGGAHWANYYQRSVAHNTVTVKDPREQFLWEKTPVVNDGGQRWPRDGREPVTLDALLKDYRAGEVLAHQFGPDPARPLYSHLCGKIQSYGPKVENFTRSFVFLNLGQKEHPAVLAVYDRVRAAQPSFAKNWLLHAMEKPRVEPGGFSVTSLWGGRMDAAVLLPHAGGYAINVLGGPGAEYMVDGKNYPPAHSGGDDEGAGWRLELAPTLPQKQDRFLVVMQVHDNQPASRPLPVTPLETHDCVGFLIADHAVFFPKEDGLLEGTLTLELPGRGPLKLTVTGLAAGSWSVQGQENTPPLSVTEEGHLAHLQTLSRKVVLKLADGRKAKP